MKSPERSPQSPGARAHTRVHTHTRVYTLKHAHACTHTHTHALDPFPSARGQRALATPARTNARVPDEGL